MRLSLFSIVAILCFMSSQIAAQPICMDYDFSGNRFSRNNCSNSSLTGGGEARNGLAESTSQTSPSASAIITGKVVPNPNDGRFEIVLSEAITAGEFEIFSVQGDQILKQPAQGESNTFDLPDVPSGNYYLVLKADSKLVGQWIILKN